MLKRRDSCRRARGVVQAVDERLRLAERRRMERGDARAEKLANLVEGRR